MSASTTMLQPSPSRAANQLKSDAYKQKSGSERTKRKTLIGAGRKPVYPGAALSWQGRRELMIG